MSRPAVLPPLPDRPEARRLIETARSLGVGYGCERSFRLGRGELLGERFLLSVAVGAIGGDSQARLRRAVVGLGPPDPVLAEVDRHVAAARFVHFGFEAGPRSSALYKVYLEFDTRAARSGPVLQHIGLKWSPDDPGRCVTTHYTWYPQLDGRGIADRLASIYDGGGPAYELAGGLLVQALAESDPPRYLEVTEPGNPRRSFDLLVYDAGLTLEDVRPYLLKAGELCGLPPGRVGEYLAPIAEQAFGHLAGGVHRDGQGFFTIYHGVEAHEGPADASRKLVGEVRESDRRREMAADDDVYHDYCLWDYRPVAPTEGKYRSVNLLYQSFEQAGIDDRAHGLVDRLRTGIGPFRTVFGIKWNGERLGWEYYFYDYARREREVSMTRVLEAIRPQAGSSVPVNENLPYFMFSLDIDEALVAGARTIDEIHMYVGNVGGQVSSGIAYSLTAERTKLENFYFFFDGRRAREEAAAKILSSAFVDMSRIDVDRILRPELRDCRTICVANKQGNDCVYFSEINVDQLLFFLELLSYPAGTIDFVRTNRAKLDHLLYDVGFDYRMQGDELVIVKSGYYGVF